MTGTVLLVGGSGKTSSRIAKLLKDHNISILLTSRKGPAGVPAGFKGVLFDFYDESTYANPFNEDKDITTVYVVLPPPKPGHDWVAITKQFIDFAKDKGVNRFLLLTATVAEKGGMGHGQVHAYLDSIGVDYAVLRPSWFYGNFLIMSTIKDKDEIVTATGQGKLGFIAEDDIADVAVELLTSPTLGGVDRIIVGPELLSYEDIAEQLSQVLGRKIIHRSVSADERKANHLNAGLPEEVAGILAYLEANLVAAGSEEKIYQTPNKAVGKIRFKEFAEENKHVWQK